MNESCIPKRHEILFKDWNELSDLYLKQWPRYALSHYLLKTYIKWLTGNSELDVKIYTSDENWRTHGTYVLEEYNGAQCSVHFNTLDSNIYESSMLKALHEFPAERDCTLVAFVDQVRDIVEIYFNNLGLKDFQKKICSLVYHLPQRHSLALTAEDKAGYVLRPLSEEYAKQIDLLRPDKYPGSDKIISNVIRYNLTLGAFEERTGKLCAWIMQEQLGTVGLLQVLDSYKRPRLGEQLLRHMVKLMANADIDALAVVPMSSNRSAKKLYHKLGFKIIDRAYWCDKIGVVINRKCQPQ